MSIHRFFLEGTEALGRPGDEVDLEGSLARRLARVLRMRTGEQFMLFDATRELTATILAAGPHLRAHLGEERQAPRTLQPKVTLYQGLIRLNRFEWLIEKGTELGVCAFVPVISERTAVRAEEIGAARLDRWQRISIEATEQSGGFSPARICRPVRFRDALDQAEGQRIMAWENLRTAASGTTIAALLPHHLPSISLFIGPEGGFSESEAELAQERGTILTELGPRLLRSETAALAACSLLLLS